MKKAFFISTFFALLFSSSYAQYLYKPFRIDLGIGNSHSFTTSSKEDIEQSFILNFEPKYSILPQISVGFRTELNIFEHSLKYLYRNDYYNYYGNPESASRTTYSFLFTGNYHLSNVKFRPFAGFGLGVSHLPGCSYSYFVDRYYGDNYEADPFPDKRKISDKIHFSAILRSGFDVKFFRFALEYNFMGHNQNVSFN